MNTKTNKQDLPSLVGANGSAAYEPWQTRKFTEAAYFSAFKTVRNKIRRFDPALMTQAALDYLHTPFKTQLDYIQRKPWIVLLIIKWALVDDQTNFSGRPGPSNNQFLEILASADSVGERTRLPHEFDDISLFLRAIAYQQFLYQRRGSPIVIARQSLYFAGLNDQHYIPATFYALTGMQLSRFLTLSHALYLAFSDSKAPRAIGSEWFDLMAADFPTEEIKRYLIVDPRFETVTAG